MNTRRKELSKRERRMALEAYLSVQGMSGKEIYEHLPEDDKVSLPEVSRDLTDAEANDWITRVFLKSNFDQETMNVIKEQAHHAPWLSLEGKLKQQSGNVLKKLRVFYSGSKNTNPEKRIDWDRWIKRFAINSSWYINELLNNSKEGIAVGWGKTLTSVIEAISSYESSQPVENSRRKIRVIPTAGDPLGNAHVNLETASTSLAEKLSDHLNGPGRHDIPSLAGIPPVIPEEFKSADKLKIVKEFIRTMRSHMEIFGDPNGPTNKPPLIRKVDTVLTSAGSFHSWFQYKSQMISVGGVAKEDLEKYVLGDIGGLLIPHERVENDPNAKKKFDEIDSLWTGIRLDDYRKIAMEASESDEPGCAAGVILCVIGFNKVDIVYDLITRIRVVNTLVCDDTVAMLLRSKLPK
jgi:hypothetical protein